MFITINRYDNQESTININSIIEFRVYRASDKKEYVTIFMTQGHIDITLEQYEALLKAIHRSIAYEKTVTKCKVNVPIS